MRLKAVFGKPLGPRLRALGIDCLLATFAATFRVEAPRVFALAPDEALFAFRAFSAACMQEAFGSAEYALEKRAELEARARRLGTLARKLLLPSDEELPQLIAVLYDAIGICVTCAPCGQLRFARCYFSECYTPRLCAFMSAFDSGFVGGLAGGKALVFSERITEGAPCCLATLVREGDVT